ncbi:putative mitochondrial protein AtMg00860 [Bidens hawaiensis]|uniref:putative mitochondrial protein AtMg00860 n=1 Tax=Bidens hawaiensis TaxID=980011 RepID=UPI004049CB59
MAGEGFKANPDMVQEIVRMPSPSSLKEVQTLNGIFVALNRFLADHAAKSYPFVSTLCNYLKKEHFKWTPEAEKAFLEVKKCLMELPTLAAPHEGEPLMLYLSASDIAVGAVLLTDRKTVL